MIHKQLLFLSQIKKCNSSYQGSVFNMLVLITCPRYREIAVALSRGGLSNSPHPFSSKGNNSCLQKEGNLNLLIKRIFNKLDFGFGIRDLNFGLESRSKRNIAFLKKNKNRLLHQPCKKVRRKKYVIILDFYLIVEATSIELDNN